MILKYLFDMQMFAQGGEVVNATTTYTNAYTGHTDAMPDAAGNSMLPTTGKTFYDTQLLENVVPQLVYAQFGRKESLPANHGRTMEWRKWNTLPQAGTLQEGVIPTGKRFGMTSTTVSLQQYGMFLAITDLLDLHAIDNVLVGATQELSSSAKLTKDTLVRNALMSATNEMFADNVNATGVASPVKKFSEMKLDENRLTPDMVNQAVTFLRACDVQPMGDGKFVAVIHPYAAYDLMKSEDWVKAHIYANVTPLYNGEIGEIFGCRFVQTTNAPIHQQTTADGAAMVFDTFFFGKDAFATIDVGGGNLEMIVKDRSQAGGPLEQFSTAGYKFEDATKILYQERMIKMHHLSAYSSKATANYDVDYIEDAVTGPGE